MVTATILLVVGAVGIAALFAFIWMAYLMQMVKHEEEIIEHILEEKRRREEARRQKEDSKQTKQREEAMAIEAAKHFLQDSQGS